MNAPLRTPKFIDELCLALAHRLEPERLFMILTSYMDESGTHGDSPVTIVAAVMGNVKQWSVFECDLEKIRKRYGFRVYHGKDFKARRGEFKGWEVEKCLLLIGEMARLTANCLMHGSVISIDNGAFKAQYLEGDKPKKLRLDSSYGLAFRGCLLHQIQEALRRLSHHKKFEATLLHVVMESGHKNAADAQRIYHEEMKHLQKLGCNLLAGITFEDKERCAPLMVSDFLAHSTFLRDDKGLAPQPESDLAGIREKTGLTHLSFDPDGLATLKASLIKEIEDSHAYSASRRRSSASPMGEKKKQVS